MVSGSDILEVLRTTRDFLLFKPAAPDVGRLGPLYLAFGLIFTWAAGIGRNWDNPRVDAWQHFGLASVAYVFVFAALLWLLLWPLKPRNWHYRNVLIFVTMTAPPALLYALPGRFLAGDAMALAKAWLLAVVALWRVALLWRYLRGSAGLQGAVLMTALSLPLVLVVTALVALNLDRAVFDIMGGGGLHTADDDAYQLLITIDFFSILAAPLLLGFYGWHCWRAWRPAENAAPAK
jgi:hypothetical protein